MRGPLHALWNARLVGGYLRVRVALLLVSVLAVASVGLAVDVGGAVGAVLLLAPAMAVLCALAAMLLVR